MIYELRVYEAMPGKIQRLHNRFANHTLGYFKKYGIQALGFWTEEIGTTNRLTYMLVYEDLSDRERKWSAFRADAEWGQVVAESEKDGPLLVRITNSIMHPTPYSPMQ